MNKLETGKIYTAARHRTGTSANGSWELIATTDERGNNDIAVFASNIPSGVEEGGKFRIEKITAVSYGNKKDQSGNWRASISINAEVSPVMSYDEFSKPAPEDDDGSLPF